MVSRWLSLCMQVHEVYLLILGRLMQIQMYH